MRGPGEDCPCLHSRAPVYLASGAARARRLSQIAALLRNGLMAVGPALVHFALSQVLGLNLRFEIHDSDTSRLSLEMALRSSLICPSEGRSCGELTILIWEWATKRRDDKRWCWYIG